MPPPAGAAGSVEAAVADGLALRHDGGPCFRSAHYQAEIDHLAIGRSPAFHYEPETNGCVEKFIQTLKEQVLWIERFDTLAELRAAIRTFAERYNREWLLEAHNYRTPLGLDARGVRLNAVSLAPLAAHQANAAKAGLGTRAGARSLYPGARSLHLWGAIGVASTSRGEKRELGGSCG